MSNDLETIIRPSQSLDYAPAKVYYTPGQVGVPNTKLQWGRGGSGKTFNGSYTYNATFYMTKYRVERSPFAIRKDAFGNFTGKFGEGTIGQPLGGN